MKAYLNLTALQKRVPKAYEVREQYVREYNSILDALAQATGYNLEDFHVPESEVHLKHISFTADLYTKSPSPVTDNYAPGLYCERAVLMKKLGTLLQCFTAPSSIQEKMEVSFKLPDKRGSKVE